MNDMEKNNIEIEKIKNLSEKEMESIFNQMDITDVNMLLDLLNEVGGKK